MQQTTVVDLLALLVKDTLVDRSLLNEGVNDLQLSVLKHGPRSLVCVQGDR